jgi:rubredoxin
VNLLSNAYLCPNCKTNRTRFNIIEQIAKSVKIDKETGEILEEFGEEIGPFHIPYRGPNFKIQCGVCGLIEDELSFIKRAQNHH